MVDSNAKARRGIRDRVPMISDGADTKVLETAGIISLRILSVAAVAYLGFLLFIRVRAVALPIITAMLIGSVLQPLATKLRKVGVPRSLAAVIVFVGSILVLTLMGSFVVRQVVDQAPEIELRANEAIDELQDRLTKPPFNVDPERMDNFDEQLGDWINDSGIVNADSAASIGGFATSVFSGLFIALTVLFFICKDGDRFPAYLAVLVGDGRADRLNRVGSEIWQTTASYLRGVGLTGLVDGILIGIALAILDVPLYVPLALLTFMGAFIPVVGATLAGILAAGIALATNGPGTALIVVVVVLGVQQLEGNFLAPLLLGRAVALHPVTILLSLAIGATVAGIWGALLAVPAAAAIRIALTEFVPSLHRAHELELAIEAAETHDQKPTQEPPK
ncbi:MAG: AI-2E family transporter [Acidimicrobiales bacterium]|nr:AI-2E family transporter [Acidimicrobiales bacterium]